MANQNVRFICVEDVDLIKCSGQVHDIFDFKRFDPNRDKLIAEVPDNKF